MDCILFFYSISTLLDLFSFLTCNVNVVLSAFVICCRESKILGRSIVSHWLSQVDSSTERAYTFFKVRKWF